jgi:hypothetical protein
MSKILTIIVGFLGLFAIGLLYGALSWGLVCWKFWYWFLLPVFPQLPQITFLQAIALMMFMGLLRGHPAQIIKEEYTNQKLFNIIAYIGPWLTLFVGWLFHITILR